MRFWIPRGKKKIIDMMYDHIVMLENKAEAFSAEIEELKSEHFEAMTASKAERKSARSYADILVKGAEKDVKEIYNKMIDVHRRYREEIESTKFLRSIVRRQNVILVKAGKKPISLKPLLCEGEENGI